MRRKALAIWLLLGVAVLAGCTPVFTKDALRRVDPSVSFAALRANPNAYLGRYLILGGVIAKVTNTSQGAEIEVVQFRLNSERRPVESLDSGGRFLATTKGFLDPQIYKAGRLISLVGQVTGEVSRPLGGIEYRYPVLKIFEFHIWVPERMRYSPPPYPYYYDPYYYDPFFVNPYFYPYWYPYRYRVYPTPSPRLQNLQEERKEKSGHDSPLRAK